MAETSWGQIPGMSGEQATKVRWIYWYLSRLPDPLRRKVIDQLSADFETWDAECIEFGCTDPDHSSR